MGASATEAGRATGTRGGGRTGRFARSAAGSLAVHALLLAVLVVADPVPRPPPGDVSRVPLRLVPRPSGPSVSADRAIASRTGRTAAPAAPAPRPASARTGRPEPAPRDRNPPPGTADPRTVPAAPPSVAAGNAATGVPAAGGTGEAGPGSAAGTAEIGAGAPSAARTADDSDARPAAQAAGSLALARHRYGEGIGRRLREASRYPESARRAGRDGQVVLRLRVDADGSVRDAAIRASSEWEDLDRAAVGVAMRLTGLPPPPGGPIDVDVPIDFTLRRP